MSLKRSTSNITPPSLHRSRPDCVGFTPFAILNTVDGETVHQTCLLVTGQCHYFNEASAEDFVSARTHGGLTENAYNLMPWPVAGGTWKALVRLSPGPNQLDFELHHAGGVCGSHSITVNYIPLLQVPPLHLAIMVARDSPLLIDCPPSKQGAISSAHSSLDAAIAKFRTTAYMWQALTAEDLRLKGLDRRSFRLEEEWSNDTITRHGHCVFPEASTENATVPRIHIVRTEKTVAELRDSKYAQQNPTAQEPDELHKIFENALKAYGGPFALSNRPVVAGLILDSSYSIGKDLIHGHAALGCHNSNGLSLGIFGSHLTYSWPRFFEEIPACLLDTTLTGDTVGNDNGECNTLREACSVGQGAFLHEVGHAFGADHTTGIMARGYSKHWPRNFLGHVDNDNDAKFDLQDALQFRAMPHFRIPGDKMTSPDLLLRAVDIKPVFDAESESIEIACPVGIAFVDFDNKTFANRMEMMNWNEPCTGVTIDLEARYDRSKPLSVSVLAMNGRKRTIKDVWKFMQQKSFIRIPGSDIVLRKQSVRSDEMEKNCNDTQFHQWALLLRERNPSGKVRHAESIDLRVGCIFDGAVVYYDDDHKVNCGIPSQRHYGGHASDRGRIPENSNVAKVEIRKYAHDQGWSCLVGIRITLSDGTKFGELHDHDSQDYHEPSCETVVLEPGDGDKVVGLYGTSQKGSGFCYEFGIITAPKQRELPDVVYTMRELKNVEGGESEEEANGNDLDDMDCSNSGISEDYDRISEHGAEEFM